MTLINNNTLTLHRKIVFKRMILFFFILHFYMNYLSNYSIHHFLKKTIHLENNNSYYPKISIVIASFNQGHFIEKTIISIINQQYNNYEIIVIDGASKDNTIEILKKYNKYIRFWVSEPDKGQTDAINKGFTKATGDLICFQNSDDVFHPNCFINIAKSFIKNPLFDGYYGDLSIIDSKDNVYEIIKTIPFHLPSQLFLGMQIYNQSYFFSKQSLAKYGSLDENLRFVLDYEFVTRWACLGAKFKYVANALGAFRIHEDSKTTNLEQIRITELSQVMQQYRQRYNFKNLDKWQVLSLKLRKIIYFIKQLDFSYLYHRITVKLGN